MSAIATIVGKDLRQRMRDKSFLIIGIVAPLVLAVVLATVGGDAFAGRVEIKMQIIDETGEFAGPLLAGLEEAGLTGVTLGESELLARSAVQDGDLSAALIIPKGFLTALSDPSQPARILVLKRPDAPIAASVAQAVADRLVLDVNFDRLAQASVRVAGGGLDLDLSSPTQDSRIDLKPIGTETRVLDGVTYLSIGMATFFLFFAVQGGVMSILEERRQHTMQRMLAAPVSRSSVMIAKFLSAGVGGLVSILVMAAATSLMLGAKWGSLLGVILLATAGVLVALTLGAAVGGLAKNVDQGQQFGAIMATVLGLIGGAFFPVSQGPPSLRLLSKVSPHFWLLRGFGANTVSPDPLWPTGWDFWGSVIVLLGMSGALAGIGYTGRAKLTGLGR